MIKINNLSVEIEGKQVLNNVNINIPEGEVHLLLGPNGSGKTSLMMTVIGYPQYRITNGNISVNDRDLLELDHYRTSASWYGHGRNSVLPP